MSDQQDVNRLRELYEASYDELGDVRPDQTFVGNPLVAISNECACESLGPNPVAGRFDR
jgi:hypothetical protein